MKYSFQETKRVVLSDEQEKIIENNTFPQYLDANAGSGKTQVLTHKVIEVLKQNNDLDLSSFAIITFTKKAADEMKTRLYKNLYFEWLTLEKNNDKNAEVFRKNVDICNMSQISTIHSLCESILRDYGMYIGISNTFVVSSFNKEQQKIIEETVNEFKDNKLLHKIPQFKLVKLVNNFMKLCISKGYTLDTNTLKNVNNCDYPNDTLYILFKSIFENIYKISITKINEYKTAKNLVTIDDLILNVNELLDIPFVCDIISKKYKYIFLDELQDTSKDQFEIFIKLSKCGSKLFCVGDEKQSIYSFRGADIENAEKFRKIIKMTARNFEDKLSLNHRTDPDLLRFINTIFSKPFTYEGNILNFPKTNLQTYKDKNLCSEVSKFYYQTPLHTIIDYIINNIKIGNRNAEYGDIAVLFRRNHDLDGAAKELKEKSIPVEVMGGKSFYKSKEIIDVYKIFNSILHKTKVAYAETFFTDYYLAFSQLNSANYWLDFYNELESVFRMRPIEEILNFIWDKTSIFKYYKNQDNVQSIANLLKLKDIVQNLKDNELVQPLEFLNYLEIMITSQKEENDGAIDYKDRKSGVISLYTVHKAKGLEFPIVIIPKCDLTLKRFTTIPEILFDGKILGFRKDLFGKQNRKSDKSYLKLVNDKILKIMEEEIRILYVACTRAQNMLIFSCDGSTEDILDNDNASWAKWILKSGMLD